MSGAPNTTSGIVQFAEIDLRSYFGEVESRFGIRSIQGRMNDMALSGFGGGGDPSPDGRLTRLVEVGSRATVTTHARRTWSALRALSPADTDVLWAVYGPHDWTAAIDRVFVMGTGHRLAKAFGDLVGAATLTPTVHRGFAAATERVRAEVAAARPATRTIDGAVIAGTPAQATRHDIESDEALRERAIASVGGRPLPYEHSGLYDAAGARLDWIAWSPIWGAPPGEAEPGLVRDHRCSPRAPDLVHLSDERWRSPGGYLVSLFVGKSGVESTKLIQRIAGEAKAARAAAIARYVAATGAPPPEPDEVRAVLEVQEVQREPGREPTKRASRARAKPSLLWDGES